MIKKFNEIEAKLRHIRHDLPQRGELTGFSNLDALYTLKRGSFTFVLAPPHHGKSEFSFELLINQASKYNKRALIYSPETGSVEDIYAELIHKLSGRTIVEKTGYACDDKEYYHWCNWIDHYFDIVDGDEKSYSLDELYDLSVENKNDIILADPWNELNHSKMKEYGSRQDLYIEDLIGDLRRFTKKENKHVLITLHPANQQIKETDGIRHYPMPMAREAAGGQSLFRKAMTWINVWRPTHGLKNEHGIPYEENEVIVLIEKAKPKHVSVRGKCSLFFDWKRNRYYEKINNIEYYAFNHENNQPIYQVSEEFNF